MKQNTSIKPRSSARFSVLAASLLVAACTTTPMREYPRQHPANANASQAPVPAALSALDSYRAPAAKGPSSPSVVPGENPHERH